MKYKKEKDKSKNCPHDPPFPSPHDPHCNIMTSHTEQILIIVRLGIKQF